MNHLKFIQEKKSGLFFQPVPGKPHSPIADRKHGWLYDEYKLLEVIRIWYGGDHGVEKVTLIEPSSKEFFAWCGRRGGSRTSVKKQRTARANGRKHKKHRGDFADGPV